ncbi:MAG: thioesterase family protein [Chitinophagaceae bacterium]|nr:thioesterase family protein [Chitinophagaceae bacterium]
MTAFRKKLSLRWADLDPNFHLRHSVYYDFGAEQRVEILETHGLTLKFMQENFLGPVLFREECIFRREIRLGDEVTITARLAKMKADASRWSIQHEFMRADKKLLATLTVDGAWIDTKLRKLAPSMPAIVKEVFEHFPKTDDFALL